MGADGWVTIIAHDTLITCPYWKRIWDFDDVHEQEVFGKRCYSLYGSTERGWWWEPTIKAHDGELETLYEFIEAHGDTLKVWT